MLSLSRSFRFVILTLFIGSLVTAGCSSDPSNPTDGDGGGNDGEIDTLLDLAGALDDLSFVATGVLNDDPSPTGEPVDDAVDVRADGSSWQCRRQTVTDVNAEEDYWTFNPNSTVIWPGNLLQGESLINATPAQIIVDRAPLDVAITLLNGSDPLGTAATVENPTITNMQVALNTILGNNPGILPANFTYSSVAVSSHEEMAAKLGVDISTLTSDFKAQLSFSTASSKSSVLVSFQQQMYTMVIAPPTSLAGFFASSVTSEILAPFVGPANPPTYISAVTYGRRFYALIQSNESQFDLETSIEASYDGAVTDGQIDAEFEYVTDLAGVSIKVFNMGGTASSIPSVLEGGTLTNLHELLAAEDSDLFYTAMPLSYIVNDLRTHQIVYVKSATEYDVVECYPLDVSDEDRIFQFVANDLTGVQSENLVTPQAASNDHWTASSNGTLEYWPDGATGFNGHYLVEKWVGTGGTTATYDGERPILFPTQTPTGKAAVGFVSVNLPTAYMDNPSFSSTEMTFSGALLENTDYTISAVIKIEEEFDIWQYDDIWGAEMLYSRNYDNDANAFLYGTTTGPIGDRKLWQNLVFGTHIVDASGPSSRRMYLAHEGYFGDIPEEDSTGLRYGIVELDIFQILTVVFKQTSPEQRAYVEFWINGNKIIHTEPELHPFYNFSDPVQSFAGARLGASFYNIWEEVLGSGNSTKAAFLHMAEIRAYGVALNDLQLEKMIADMRAEYGI
ncbi:MAG: hypothetical protein ACI9UQ_001920 [Candidatus Krumholzibacteriia bacterium]|jgi:hypothetical protein